MTEIIYIICGAVFGGFIVWSLMTKQKIQFVKTLWEERGTGRFGIINVSGYSSKGYIEVEELQIAGTHTKVRIVKVYPNTSSNENDCLSTIHCKGKNEAWVESRSIEWFNNANQYMRDKRLGDILNKEDGD
jgi:hypothetical protein